MVNYKCFRCGYETKFKSSFINHLNRKNMCNPLLDDICIEEVKKWYKIDVSKNIQQVEPVFEQVEPVFEQVKPVLEQVESVFEQVKNNRQNQEKTGKPDFGAGKNQEKPAFCKKSAKICDFCGKEFTRVYGLTCHLKTCKIKKEKDKEKENEKDKKIEELIKTQEAMKEQMKEMVEKLLINNSGNITNNNHNNSHNIIHNTININNFGNENIKYLRKDYLNTLLQGAFTAIPKLIEKIHFNPKHPENHNIKITNKKEPYIKVRKNDKWEIQDKKETLENLVDEKYYILEDHYAEVEETEEITEKTKNVMNKFRNKFTENKELQKDLQKKSEMIILNNSQ